MLSKADAGVSPLGGKYLAGAGMVERRTLKHYRLVLIIGNSDVGGIDVCLELCITHNSRLWAEAC